MLAWTFSSSLFSFYILQGAFSFYLYIFFVFWLLASSLGHCHWPLKELLTELDDFGATASFLAAGNNDSGA